MIYELRQRDLTVIAEQLVPIRYKGVVFEGGYRLDLQVSEQVIVELKAVETILPVHHAPNSEPSSVLLRASVSLC